MRNALVQRLLVVTLSAAVGCQGGPAWLSRAADGKSHRPQQPPAAGGDSESQPAGPDPRLPPPAAEIKPAMAAQTPAVSAAKPAATIQPVTYLTAAAQSPDAPAAPSETAATSQVAVQDTGEAAPTPLADFARSLVPGSEPTFYLEKAVMRGQTPARDFFLSDRFIAAAVIISAIVIPFAVHDSRQPLPTVNGTQP